VFLLIKLGIFFRGISVFYVVIASECALSCLGWAVLILILYGWFLGYIFVFVQYYRNCIGFLVLFTDFHDGA
jgi:hypothetical protein